MPRLCREGRGAGGRTTHVVRSGATRGVCAPAWAALGRAASAWDGRLCAACGVAVAAPARVREARQRCGPRAETCLDAP